jgi:SAM-dependent methyltransferase
VFRRRVNRPQEEFKVATGYAIAGGSAGKQRLDVLARVMAPATVALFDRVGIPNGATCVDVGCGGGHVTAELARRAGSRGWVVGIDADEPLLELAAGDLGRDGVTNVEFRCQDASEIDKSEFDLAYARLLLSHVSDPKRVLDAMVGSLRAGGVVVVEDLDVSDYRCYPPTPAHDRWVEIYRETIRRRGGDPHLGQTLPRRLVGAGLRGVAVTITQPCALRGDAKLVAPMALRAMTEFVTGEGVASAEEVDEIVAELYRYAADPTTLMGLPRIVQSWGRTTTED